MIQLDTNLLILAVHADERVMLAFERWLDTGETVAVSSITWLEFICGPLREDAVGLVARIISGNIVAFDSVQAQRAAELFNVAGRKRAARWGCMVAVAALAAGARLATLNRADFSPFVSAGLVLAEV